MDRLVRISGGLVGLAIIGCVAHSAIVAAGGYGANGAPLLIALACGSAVGAMAVGVAWREERRLMSVLIAVGLVAGEAYALLLTSERTLEARELRQAPIRASARDRARAEARLEVAERALTATGTSERLERALAAKAAADAAVVAKAAERDCAVNCRALLEQQVTAAAAEVAAARAELSALRKAAEAELGAARAALAALPAPASVSPLADRLGIAGWQIDLAAAALASLAANGLGAFLLAFAAHGRSAGSLAGIASAPRNAMAEADAFAREVFRPEPGGRVAIAAIREAYRAWCRSRAIDPLPDTEIGRALATLFGSLGVYRIGTGAEAEICGLRWATSQPGTQAGRSRTGGARRLARVKGRVLLEHEAMSQGSR